MKLSDKIRYLREVEGQLRGLGRAMTQGELVRAMRDEMDEANGANGSLSQSYLSQIESGARPHLTNTTRQVLARFFKVHPGYLVDDPEGYHAELLSDARTLEDKLDLWLVSGAERFRRDPELRRALLALSRHADSRRCLLLLEAVIDTPGLRSFGLGHVSPEGVVSAFPDLAEGAEQCPAGCAHLAGDCALDEWARDHHATARLESLRRLLRSRESPDT